MSQLIDHSDCGTFFNLHLLDLRLRPSIAYLDSPACAQREIHLPAERFDP